ncbi:MAG: SDR family NAD(P)-dependent oxidoreductase [Coriobacteriia bacterium]|nr:SDR family NAD(P)-dependent oxidoreductase [Coriobacteriia bacterium]
MGVAIITGASSGLGSAYVDAVLDGFPEIEEIWLVARREERLREVARRHPDKRFEIIPADLARKEGWQALEAKLVEKRPGVWLLINDAGLCRGGSFEGSRLDDLLAMIDLNCKGLTAVTHICLPYLAQGSTIIEVASTSAFVPNTGLVAYSATKSYVQALALGLREELRPRDINVCAVCPGMMETEMTTNPTVRQAWLPRVNVARAAAKSLAAARAGRAVHTTDAFYKGYRLLAKLAPHTLLVKFAGLG